MIDLAQLAAQVFTTTALQETHWREWKSAVDLGERAWQARVARFIRAPGGVTIGLSDPTT